MAAAAISELHAPGSLPVVLADGHLGNTRFRRTASRAVAQRLPGTEVSVLTDEPVAGAVRLAGMAVPP